ncbi:MAG: hypothetical protein HYW26_00785 [Candidatus Aenigmarchaeota archaeon]|nr:hypothetical protein [Candidatus Aenigmarchaeota archaeon]
MAEVVWLDDVHAPAEWVIRLRGKRPYQLAEMAPDILRRVMKVQTKNIFELDIRWDLTGDPRTFYGYWEGHRTEDQWTRTTLKITIQGEQSAADGTGTAHVRVRGVIATRYPYHNFIQRTFWWFYNRFFYYQQRRNYLFKTKDEILQMREIMLRTFGVNEEEVSR